MSGRKFSKQAELDFMHNFRHDTEGDQWAKHEIESLRQQLAEAQVFEALWAGACEVAKNDPVQAIYRLREQVTLLQNAIYDLEDFAAGDAAAECYL